MNGKYGRSGMKFLFLLLVFLLPFCLLRGGPLCDHRTGKPVRYSADARDTRVVMMPRSYVPRTGMFRGAWVATSWNIDFPRCDTPDAFRNHFRRLVSRLKAAGFNAVIFQIRPSCDAYYPSSINPWTANLRGREGAGYSNFDPLQFMVQESHRQGLSFHAWMNPYRVKAMTPLGKQALSTLSPKNFARCNPDAVLEIKSGKGYILMLDPGNPKSVRHILDSIREVLNRYDVDAIHFDDYFYPYSGMKNEDVVSYRKYGRGLSLAAWRRSNTDALVRSISAMILRHNAARRKRVEFGLSPFGIWMNSKHNPAGSLTHGHEAYSELYADTLKWVRSGWVDYVVPQIYWAFADTHAPFACTLDWWRNAVRNTHVKLYVGYGLQYLSPGKHSLLEIRNQLIYSSVRPEVRGAVFFSANALFSPKNRTMRDNAVNAVSLWGGKL